MTFQEAEKTYKDVRSQHAGGKLNDADFEAQVNQLKVQDAQGHWWQLGVRTGEWYYNDGQKWVKAKPPTASAPAAMPMSAPEDEAAKEEKAERPSVMPRGIISPKPEAHNGGGLPRPVLIGIIAVVALLVIGLLVGAFVLFGGSLFGGATARATVTPTRAVAILPTTEATATPASTDTPAPTVTLVVTATNTLANPPTPTGTRATATRRPATATPTKAGAPAVTATPQAPPGLYVTKIQLDPAAPEPNVKFGFRVTFFNNSGGNAHKDKWQILIFQVNNQDKSFGDTPILTLDVPAGTNDVTMTQAYSLGTSGPPDCNYVAGAYYYDDNNNRVPFPNTDGKQFRLSFSMCK